MKYLILLFILNSCVTPDMWTPREHESMMLKCRAMCGSGRVKSYEPIVGQCVCHKPSKILED